MEYASVLAKGLSSSQELIVHDADSADSAPEDERRLPTGPGDYRGKPQAELLSLLIKRDRDNKVLQTRLRLTQRRVYYYKQCLGKARDSLKRKRDDALGAREFQGEHSCWYTPRGGYLLAARRCLSNCAAYGLGFALTRNIHHTTVSRWEIKLRAAFVAAGRCFFHSATSELVQHRAGREPGWMFFINQYRSDATNAAVWQRSKLHVTEITSCFTPQPILEETPFAEVLRQAQRQTILGDLQVVKDGSAEGTFSCIRKQIKSIGGCRDTFLATSPSLPMLDAARPRPAIDMFWDLSDQPLPGEVLNTASADASSSISSGPWSRRQDQLQPALGSAVHAETPQPCRNEEGPEGSLLIWLACTDAGTDERKARTMMRAKAEDDSNIPAV